MQQTVPLIKTRLRGNPYWYRKWVRHECDERDEFLWKRLDEFINEHLEDGTLYDVENISYFVTCYEWTMPDEDWKVNRYWNHSMATLRADKSRRVMHNRKNSRVAQWSRAEPRPDKYLDDVVAFSKTIFTDGKSRGYYKFLLQYVYNIENLLFSKLEYQVIEPRLVRNKRFAPILKNLTARCIYYDVYNILDLFRAYIILTEPVLAFFLIKKRSFKRNKKIYKINYSLKMAYGLRRRNKLFQQVKAVFFTSLTRRSKGHLRYSTLSFLYKEVMKMGYSTLVKNKRRVYNRYGVDVMNDILHNEKVR